MSTREAQIARFWSNYLSELEKARVRQDRRRWYVVRAERFLEWIQPRRLAQLTADDVSKYLSEVGRDTSLEGWQCVQVVDAIRILGVTASAPWVERLDWGYWRDSARTLAPEHPTVARDYGPEVGGLEPQGPMTNLSAVREAHRELADRMVTEIRRRGYSIRTEQNYLDWVLRKTGDMRKTGDRPRFCARLAKNERPRKRILMPRHARIVAAGFPLHAILRGIDRSAIFFDEADDRALLGMLVERAAAESVCVHAYVLMTNHLHLLMTPATDREPSLLMKGLGQRYVQYINRTYRRTGTLFEGRFRSSVIEADSYLLACQRYIELNPVRARVVQAPGDYPWSSYRCNALGVRDLVVVPHSIYCALAEGEQARRARYLSLFADEISEGDLTAIRDATQRRVRARQ